MLFLCEAVLGTARRVLSHDDPQWEASEIGYTVIAPMQGYAQLAEMETDGAAFSSAVASSYGLADDIFVNGSGGTCFDAYDLPLTLDTMGSHEYVGETFSDAMRDFYGPASWVTFTRSTTAGTGAMADHSDTFRITCGKKAVLGIQTLQTMHRLERSIALGAQACSVHVWDQAWAFYYGKQGKASPFTVSGKRDHDFATASEVHYPGVVVNQLIVPLFRQGQLALRLGSFNSTAALEASTAIRRLIVLTYIRAALKYSYLTCPLSLGCTASEGYGVKYHAEGYTYARAVLGFVAALNRTAAQIVEDQLSPSRAPDEFSLEAHCRVRTALQSIYPVLGIDCDMVGEGYMIQHDVCGSSCSSPRAPPIPAGVQDGYDPFAVGMFCGPGEESIAMTCNPCRAGWHNPSEGAICLPCPPGFVSASEGSSSCEPCSVGTFSLGALRHQNSYGGDTACQVCPIGFFADRTGSSACSPCAPGFFSTGGNLTEHCSPCAHGSFQPGTANSSCITCPGRMTTQAQAQISQSECVCAPDTVQLDGVCSACSIFATTHGKYDADSCTISGATIVVIIATVAGVAFILAIYAVFRWKTKKLACKYASKMKHEMKSALEGGDEFSFPMVLISFKVLRDLGGLNTHEHVRMTRANDLIFLDTVQECEEFRHKGNKIVFFSHQWSSWTEPDPTNAQYDVMLSCLDQYNASLMLSCEHSTNLIEEQTFCWVDMISIPQQHRKTQTLAIDSLPVYSANSDLFVIVAPEVQHENTGMLCDATSYQRRGWCRGEQISYFCKNGTDGMWIADTVNATVKQVTIPWVKDSIQVFQGDFTCCHRKHEGMECCDKEKLVAPILGLFGAAYELRTMHPEIYQMLMEQPDMFPETHTYEKKMENGKVVKHVKHLFGDRIGLMKDYIDNSQEGAAHQRMSMSMGRQSFASPKALGLHKSFGDLLKRLPTSSDSFLRKSPTSFGNLSPKNVRKKSASNKPVLTAVPGTAPSPPSLSGRRCVQLVVQGPPRIAPASRETAV